MKIFEAMAMAKAVVSTTVGAEGLPVTDEADLLVADTPAAFARAIVRLFRDAERRRTIESAARTLVAEHFDWSVVARDLDRALTRFAAGDPVEPRPAADALAPARATRPWPRTSDWTASGPAARRTTPTEG